MIPLPDRSPGAAAPVVTVDPHELDAAARVCAGDSVEALLGFVTLAGATEGIDMPPEVRARVTAAVQVAARQLWVLADELATLDLLLRRRAALVRLVDGDPGALLAMDLAPILRFSDGEDHWLEDPAFFLRHSSPVDDAYRDLDDDFHAGSNERAKNLYQWDPVARRLTHWFFYAYNDGTNNHEGDWERTTIEIGSDGRPARMHFSGHSGSRAVDWDDVEKDPRTGQPVVYVSKGSHAVVPHAGDYPTEAPQTPLTDDDAHGDGPRFDVSGKLPVDVTRQAWYPGQGGGIHWGDNPWVPDFAPGSAEFNGPLGPSPEKGHLP